MKHTVYLLYLKKDKSLYGYTTIDKYLNQFLDERDPDCFILKEKKMDPEKFSKFANMYRKKMMVRFPYETKKNTSIYLIATYEEDEKVAAKIEELQRNIEVIERTIRKIGLKNKYKETISRLITIDDGSGNLILDTLSIFIDIHKYTFIKNPYTTDDLSLWDSQSNNMYDNVLENF